MLLTILGQALYVLASPVLGRLYSPLEFGYFGLFFTILTSLSIFACGLYDLAIPAVQNDDEARRLSGIAIIFGVTFSVLAGVSLYVVSAQKWFGLDISPFWAGALMSACVLTQMTVLIGQAWALRRNEVLDIGRANVIMNGSRGALQVAGGLFAPTWAVMVVGEIIARLAQAKFIFRRPEYKLKKLFSNTQILITARKNRRYPLVFGPVFAIDSITILVQTGIIGLLFGAGQMGQYFVMRRTLDLPVAFAFKSLSDLFFSEQLKISRESPASLQFFFVRYAAILTAVGMILSAPLIFYGEEIFEIFYGPNWGMAGGLAALMVPAMIGNIAVAPVARVFQLSSRMYFRFFPAITNLGGTLFVAALAFAYKIDITTMTALIGFVIFIHYIVYFFSGFFAASSIYINPKLDQPSAIK